MTKLDGSGIHSSRKIRYSLEPVQDQFLAMGDHSRDFLEGLKQQHSKNCGFHARYILRQKEKYHSDDIDKAMAHACRYHAYDCKAIERILLAKSSPRTLEAMRNEKAAEEVKDICSQTLEHLEQAKQHLLTTENNRDRKDAVRDCMSAMESMLKKITGEKDIKSSIKRMRNDRCWGPDIIVKDGLSIWNRLHDMYPDVRHGNPQESEISDEEALYWIERISCYIRYISKKYKNLA